MKEHVVMTGLGCRYAKPSLRFRSGAHTLFCERMVREGGLRSAPPEEQRLVHIWESMLWRFRSREPVSGHFNAYAGKVEIHIPEELAEQYENAPSVSAGPLKRQILRAVADGAQHVVGRMPLEHTYDIKEYLSGVHVVLPEGDQAFEIGYPDTEVVPALDALVNEGLLKRASTGVFLENDAYDIVNAFGFEPAVYKRKYGAFSSDY